MRANARKLLFLLLKRSGLSESLVYELDIEFQMHGGNKGKDT